MRWNAVIASFSMQGPAEWGVHMADHQSGFEGAGRSFDSVAVFC